MAEASLEGYRRIEPTLRPREIVVFLALCGYIEATGHQDATGGEIAEWSGLSILGVRPRLTGLSDKGWVTRGVIRASRVPSEQRSHPYTPAVPREAIERLREGVNA
jgi:hypothetical protein